MSLRTGVVPGRSTRSLDRTSAVNVRLDILAVLLTIISTSSDACSCLAIDPGHLDSRLERASVIVHARVSSVRADGSAEIVVIETFKGLSPKVLVPLPPNRMCGTTLTPDEERIFFLYDQPVLTVCNKHPADQELLQALRKRKG